MTSAFGGQHSIQLSYGCSQAVADKAIAHLRQAGNGSIDPSASAKGRQWSQVRILSSAPRLCRLDKLATGVRRPERERRGCPIPSSKSIYAPLDSCPSNLSKPTNV